MSDPTEVIADFLKWQAPLRAMAQGDYLEDAAEDLLAALRADGWELYRPEECLLASVDEFTVCPVDNLPAARGRYRLVPEPKDSP